MRWWQTNQQLRQEIRLLEGVSARRAKGWADAIERLADSDAGILNNNLRAQLDEERVKTKAAEEKYERAQQFMATMDEGHERVRLELISAGARIADLEGVISQAFDHLIGVECMKKKHAKSLATAFRLLSDHIDAARKDPTT